MEDRLHIDTTPLERKAKALAAAGVTGNIDARIDQVRKENHPSAYNSAQGELDAFERAVSRGHRVEVLDTLETAKCPDARLTTPSGQQLSLEVKTAVEPPKLGGWNSRTDAANKQVKASGLPGVLSFDWTAVDLAASDFPNAQAVVSFINGKMTPDKLRSVARWEIAWNDPAGNTWLSVRTRGDDGKLDPVVTELYGVGGSRSTPSWAKLSSVTAE